MIGVVFAGFIFGGFAPIKAVGLGLVLAIGLDATIVRMLLVPATMTLLGRRNWWPPRPLQRVHDRLAQSEAVPHTSPIEPPAPDMLQMSKGLNNEHWVKRVGRVAGLW